MVRPPPRVLLADDVYKRQAGQAELDLRLEPLVLLPVLQRLTTAELARAARVCKAWHKVNTIDEVWTISFTV